MKGIAVFIAILTCMTTTCIRALAGENMISDVIMQNGKEYGFDHIFDGSGVLEFSLNNPDLNGKWKCCLKTGNLQYQEVPIEINGNRCSFDAHSMLSHTWEPDTYREFKESENRDLFILKISFGSDSGISEEREFSMGLIPCRPAIENMVFTCEYDWKYDSLYPNSLLSFDVISKDAKKFMMSWSNSNLFTDDNLFICYGREYISNDKVHIDYDADWGEYIYVSASNDFGYIHTDMISTTALITDEKNLARIEELKRQAAVNDIEQDGKSSYAWDGDVLRFDSEVNNITVFTLDGRNICHFDYAQEIDLTHLLSGLYLVNYKESITGKTITIKLLKK